MAREGQVGRTLRRRIDLLPSMAPLPEAGSAVRVQRVASDLRLLLDGQWPYVERHSAGRPQWVRRDVEPVAWFLWVRLMRGDAPQLWEELTGPFPYDPDVVPSTCLGLLAASVSFVFALFSALISRIFRH